jgi:hypothetical protein
MFYKHSSHVQPLSGDATLTQGAHELIDFAELSPQTSGWMKAGEVLAAEFSHPTGY